ncbi:MAG: sensor histidine kinase [Gammaproteobacteria bacterium]
MQLSEPSALVTESPVSPWRDVAVVIGITVASAWLAARFEFNELLFAQTRKWEPLQLDEWPVALFVLAFCLVWLSWRRNQQTRVQLLARQAAEARLSGALEENRKLAHQHLRIQESERKHLARELHDELGQYLNAIKLDAVSLVDTTVGDNPAATDAGVSRHASERIIQAVDHVYGVVSDMIRRLRPVGLDELGLVAALENCVDHWRQRLPNARFSLSVTGNFEGLSEPVNVALYRLIQEGLTNSFKHADAKHIEIALQRSEAADESRELKLTVKDDGRGTDPTLRKTGFGLSGMRERVEMMGGRFAIDSAPGRGFSFEARLPAVGLE